MLLLSMKVSCKAEAYDGRHKEEALMKLAGLKTS